MTVKCPDCGEECKLYDGNKWCCDNCRKFIAYKPEIYSRVVGYMRPVQQWNTGKQQEFKDRKHFKNPEKGEEYGN